MIAYWDTSALLAIVLQESHTPAALVANARTTLNYGWDWMRIEAESGLLRRQAPPERFAELQAQLGSFRWLSIVPSELDAVAALNARHRLRAADAGHLYCLQRTAISFPDIQLVCFDRELTAAARAEGLRVWSP